MLRRAGFLVRSSTSDRGAAFGAVVDDRLGVLVDHGAAVRAPAEPPSDLTRLHDRPGFPTKGTEFGQGRLRGGGLDVLGFRHRMLPECWGSSKFLGILHNCHLIDQKYAIHSGYKEDCRNGTNKMCILGQEKGGR